MEYLIFIPISTVLWIAYYLKGKDEQLSILNEYFTDL